MQEQVQPTKAADKPAVGAKELRLVRLRLRLALLTMAIVPMVLLSVMLHATIVQRFGQSALEMVALMVGLTIFLVTLSIWMSRQVLRPAEELANSRTELEGLYETAKADSLRDALTGLGNHRAFQEELDRELEWYARYQVPVSLLLIDLDDLKMVNDSRGHGAGDEQLRDMGQLIRGTARYADRAFRVGGDEFAILMPHTDSDGAMHIARRLLERAIQPRANGHAIPFSGGISSCPQHSTNRTQLYGQADAALYWCKRHGRASVDVFNTQRDQAASHETTNQLSTQIAHIVGERMIRPVYQPIVDLGSGRVIAYEGLSRPMADTGFADPGSMFVAADTVGRTVELDLTCLQAVVAGARSMAQDQLLTINISPRTIEAPHFSTDALLSILDRYGIRPERVVVELTEREQAEDLSRLKSTLASFQRAGLRIAADDIGAGNAGLRLLSQIRFDIVKIDLSLVQEGAQRDSSRAVLRSLRDLAGRWGASVIAEGLETAAQLHTVRELGMTAGQGYLLARPMQTPDVLTIDLDQLEAGGAVLERRLLPQPRAAADSIRTQGAY